jgi:hypothetical protein
MSFIAVLYKKGGAKKILYRIRSIDRVLAYVTRKSLELEKIDFIDNRIHVKTHYMRDPPK